MLLHILENTQESPHNKMSIELRMKNPVLYESMIYIKSYISQANPLFGIITWSHIFGGFLAEKPPKS